MESKYSVVATFEAKLGSEDRVLKELLEVQKLYESKSCHERRVLQAIDRPEKILLYENWASKEDYARHLEKPEIVEAIAVMKELLSNYNAVFAKELG